MIRCLFILVTLAWGPLIVASTNHRGDQVFFQAIAAAENTPTGHGRLGEQTPLQFHPQTIEQYMPGFHGELTPAQGRELGRKHLTWLRFELARSGVDPSPFNLALAWNCGLDRTLRGRAPEASFAYARKVVAFIKSHP